MLAESRLEHPTLTSTIRHIASMLGMSPEMLRLWQRRYEVDHGKRSGVTTEIKRLQRENAERRKANEILRPRAYFSRRSQAALDEMIWFITEHRDRFTGRAHLPGPSPASERIPDLTRLSRCCGQDAIRTAAA